MNGKHLKEALDTLTIDEVLDGGVIVAMTDDVIVRYNREAKKNGAFSAFVIGDEGIKPLGWMSIQYPQLEQRLSADVACLQDAGKSLADDIADLLEDGSEEQ